MSETNSNPTPRQGLEASDNNTTVYRWWLYDTNGNWIGIEDSCIMTYEEFNRLYPRV
jgi:hypothetical protein